MFLLEVNFESTVNLHQYQNIILLYPKWQNNKLIREKKWKKTYNCSRIKQKLRLIFAIFALRI